MKSAQPRKSYIRNTKYGKQLIVPAKHTVAKTAKRRQYEKEQTDQNTKNEPESREA